MSDAQIFILVSGQEYTLHVRVLAMESGVI